MKTRFYFNLIEISLAIAVIAVGLSSIMVLFPVGVKANSAAVADNNIPDIAGEFMGSLQAQVAGEIEQQQSAGAGEIVLYNVLHDTFNIREMTTGDSPGNWTEVSPGSALSYSNGTPRMYKFDQFSTVKVNGVDEKVVDFSAEIRLGLDSYNDFFFNGSAASIAGNAAQVAEVKKYFVGVNMEISWPADIPYKQRKALGNFKTFRLEFYNNPQVALR